MMAGPGEPGYHHVGTLDIYGFERLQTNSFEQLCINLANERLQQFFVEQVLDADQKMYEREGLGLEEFHLPDSKPVVNSIERIMGILDDHSLRAAKNLVQAGKAGMESQTDKRFCEQVHNTLIQGANQNLVVPMKLKATRNANALGLHDGFVIRHYAGEVPYETKNWIDKNNDALVPEVEALLRDSQKKMVSSLADPEALQTDTG